MSLSPEPQRGLTNPNPEPKPEAPVQSSSRPKLAWQRRLLRLSLALFTLEVGVFLVLFPWWGSWDLNYFQTLTPWLQDLWEQPSFRGAITGLGFVNIYIACLQFVHSFRRS
jgi:hypothetical protein